MKPFRCPLVRTLQFLGYHLCLDRCHTALFIIILAWFPDVSTPHFWIPALSRNCHSGFPRPTPVPVCLFPLFSPALASQPARLSQPQCTQQLPVKMSTFLYIQSHVPSAAKFHLPLLWLPHSRLKVQSQIATQIATPSTNSEFSDILCFS